ncbi:MAG: disulfide bond formation protein B [Pseudomonadota bacterium]
MNTTSPLIKPRLVNLYVFLFCAAALGIALYMEHAMMLEPCPLCIMQRVFFLATGLIALVGAIHNPASRGKMIYGALTTVTALAGAGFAIRQIYLQHLPKDQVPACLPSISYMLDADFPMKDVMKVMFSGDGNCAEVTWRDPVLNFFTIADLSLIGFAMLAATCAWQMLRK